MTIFTAPHFLSILALAAFSLPAAAQAAQPINDSAVAMVSTRGLNAANPADQATLRHGIAVAAYRVCSTVTQGAPISSDGYAECFSHAVTDARAQLESRIAESSTATSIAMK